MTLSTRIAIIEPTPVREVFDECRRLIGGQEAAYKHNEHSKTYGHGVYMNEPGQGLPAWLIVHYGVDAPLMPDDESDYEDDDRSSSPSPNGWSIEIDFDTTYGYQADNGAGCSDLHAWLIQELGRWCKDRDLTWCWYHEFTGTWHPSSHPVTILGDPELGRLKERDYATQ